jgi:4-hydroxy-tetrahydrodipicolinate reductase
MGMAMKMKKTVILGAGGRMGKAIARCLLNGAVADLELSGAVDLWDAPDLGRDIGAAAGLPEVGVPIGSDLAAAARAADVVIDFTSHFGTAGNAPRCAEWGTALVVGTTGLSAEEVAELRQAAERIPIVYAPNMSLGVNLLFALVEQAAAALRGKGYDIEIVERHHRLKKDAPSGTALGLAEAAARGYEWDLEQTRKDGRSGHEGERPQAEIGMHAVRGGDIVGDHTVLFAAEGECIELSHRATTRDTFALGALRAASWVAGRTAGLYSMKDVLGIS